MENSKANRGFDQAFQFMKQKTKVTNNDDAVDTNLKQLLLDLMAK